MSNRFPQILPGAIVLMLAGSLLSTAAADTQRKPSAKAAEPKFKAIWEPVNVKEDLELMSVHFVSPEDGWVTGGKDALNGGVILHTSDGGANWQTQVGDPQSNERAFRDLRFVGAKLGWAVQSTSGGDHKLFHTADGANWSPVGSVAQNRTDYQFVTDNTGFEATGTAILRTTNGGRSWQPSYDCRLKADIQGLTREVACSFEKVFFLNPTTGFAISREVERNAGFVFARTQDGGQTWSASIILPGENGKEGGLHFVDEHNGMLRTIDGKLFRTADAGTTWAQVSGQADGKPSFEFADTSVGWMVRYQTMIYTSDGGKHWISRSVMFPAPVAASSLPARNRGYAVGAHGMVYRYRVVPIDYSAKGMLPGPLMGPPEPK